MKRGCTPHNIETGCAVALICQRCQRCFVHCVCVPAEMRAKDATLLALALRHLSCVRKVLAGKSER